jgi:hypothetical protein
MEIPAQPLLRINLNHSRVEQFLIALLMGGIAFTARNEELYALCFSQILDFDGAGCLLTFARNLENLVFLNLDFGNRAYYGDLYLLID